MAADNREFIDPTEDYPWRSPREISARLGFSPAASSDLDDRQMPGRLWELLYAAAARRFFFSHTNHLSDRELYVLLWERWLDKPTADIPLEAHAGWLPGDDALDQFAENDSVDPGSTENGNASAKDEAAPHTPAFDQPDPALEAELEAMEPENRVPPAGQLAAENVPLLPPAEITDEALAPILWELFHNLALRGFYILHTDHLSDREIYSELWHHGLREPARLPRRSPRGGWFHDFLGSFGEEETQLWLRFYATDEGRARHAAEWPKDPIPPKEKPRFNRDWRLPKGPV